MKISIFYIMLPFLLFANVEGPSFDCNQKLSSVEKSICKNKEISKLDFSLSKLYNNVYSTLRSTQELKSTQKQWIKVRNKCTNDLCLVNTYQDRIKKLRQIRPTKTPYEPKLVYSTNDKLCKEILLNYTKEYYKGSTLQPKEESHLIQVPWNSIQSGDVNILDLGKISLQYPNKKKATLLRWQERFNWRDDTYSAYFYPSIIDNNTLKDINKTQINILKQKGKEIYPNPSIIQDFNNSKYSLSSSQWRDVDIFKYQDKYYYENKLNEYWSVSEKNITTLEILEDGTLNPTCVVEKKYTGKNLLLEKKSFSDFLDILGNITGRYGDCGTLNSGRTILSLRVPTTLEKISFNPWVESLDLESDEQLGIIDAFLEEWGYRGLWNYDVYQRYLRVKDKAKLDLVDYYLETFKVDRQTANSYANSAYKQLISAHFNIPYYGTSSKPQDSLREALLKGRTVKEIKPMLTGEWKGPKKDSYFEDTESTLFYALRYPSLVKLLLDKGIDINSTNAFGKTALMYSAQYNLYDTAKLLLKYKIDINKRTIEANNHCSYTINRQKVTALHYAVRYADSKFIKLLLDCGANKELKDTRGKTAYDWIELFKDENKLLNEKEIQTIKKILQPLSKKEAKKYAHKNLLLAQIAYQKHDYKNASALYEKALEYEPSNLNAISDLALVYYKLKEYGKAAQKADAIRWNTKASAEQKASAHYNMGIICSDVNASSSLVYEGKYYCGEAPVVYYLKSHQTKPSQARAKKVISMLFENDTMKLYNKYTLLESKDKKIKVIYPGVYTYVFSKEVLDGNVTIQSKYKNELILNHLKQIDKIKNKNSTYYVYVGKEGNVIRLYKSKDVTDKKICYDIDSKNCSNLNILY